MQHWQDLVQLQQLDLIDDASKTRPQLIFKHSVSCGISAQIQFQLHAVQEQLGEAVDLHYLDLINHRAISNAVAAHWSIPHQSPQVLLIKAGKVVHHASHFSIRAERILESA
jgi:bacillithiol system protein YtxJ